MSRKSILLLAVSLVLMAGTAAVMLWSRRTYPVTLVTKFDSGSVVGSSEINAAHLFLEEHPETRLTLESVNDDWNPARSAAVYKELLAAKTALVITSHPSNSAVATLKYLDDLSMLTLCTASTSILLSDRDDALLRIIPDARLEQESIARWCTSYGEEGTMLVIQDIGNRPYTDPAYAVFRSIIEEDGKWNLVHRPMVISDVPFSEAAAVMAEQAYDMLYILAGSYQFAIGNLAHLFHTRHPEGAILLTPWTRSPALVETAGPALDKIILPSHFPSRFKSPEVASFLDEFEERFNYSPTSMSLGVYQAMEILHQMIEAGHDTPESIRQAVIEKGVFTTRFGELWFNRFGDVVSPYYFITDLSREFP